MRVLLCCLWLLSGLSDAQATCRVDLRAEIPLEVVGGSLLVEAEVNGLAATFILDTGAQRSMVTTVAVQRLGLRLDDWVGTTTRGIGGIQPHRNADPRSFTLGGMILQRRTLTHDTSLTVGTMPRSEIAGRQVDGLLGRDFLSVFDLALDVPARRLTLYDVRGCSGRFLPWSEPYAALAVDNPMESALVARVILDGIPMRALLDTGASSSMVGAPGMARLGLNDERLANDPSDRISGQGPRLVTVHRHRFARLQIGAETMRDPELWVGPVHLTPIVDMLLGADWLMGKRIWISYATRQVFVATP